MKIDYRHLIQFLAMPTQQDSFGEVTGEWQPVGGEILASMEPLLGNELQIALSTDSKVEVKFRTYWFDGITPDMRLSCEGTVYLILSVVNVAGMNREMLIYARRLNQ